MKSNFAVFSNATLAIEPVHLIRDITHKMTSLIGGCFVYIHRVWTRDFSQLIKAIIKRKNLYQKNKQNTGRTLEQRFRPNDFDLLSFLAGTVNTNRQGTGICFIL